MTDRRIATRGVLLGISLAAVDGTVVSMAMPTDDRPGGKLHPKRSARP